MLLCVMVVAPSGCRSCNTQALSESRQLATIAGRGCVSNHSARAGTVRSIPASFHHVASLSERWTLAMVSPAQRDGKFVAHLTTERAVLHKAEVIGVRGFATASQTILAAS